MAAPNRAKIAKYGLGGGAVVFFLSLMAVCLCPVSFFLAALLAFAPVVFGTRLVKVAGLALGAASMFMAISKFRQMPTFNAEAVPIPDSLFVLDGVRIRASAADVVSRLGQPLEVTDYVDTSLADTLGHIVIAARSQWHFESPALEVHLTDSQVVSIECAAPQPCAFPLGIGIGTTRAELATRLGSPARSAESSVTYRRRTRDCDIRFQFDEAERVRAIRVRCDDPGRLGSGGP